MYVIYQLFECAYDCCMKSIRDGCYSIVSVIMLLVYLVVSLVHLASVFSMSENDVVRVWMVAGKAQPSEFHIDIQSIRE